MLLNQAPLYQTVFATSKMDCTFKLDEGYSEETRSENDLDSPMRLETIPDEAVAVPVNASPALPPAILALSEAERSGKIDFLFGPGSSVLTIDRRERIRLPCFTNTANIFDSCRRRAITTSTAHRPCGSSTNRNHIGNLLPPQPVDVVAGFKSFSVLARWNTG